MTFIIHHFTLLKKFFTVKILFVEETMEESSMVSGNDVEMGEEENEQEEDDALDETGKKFAFF